MEKTRGANSDSQRMTLQDDRKQDMTTNLNADMNMNINDRHQAAIPSNDEGDNSEKSLRVKRKKSLQSRKFRYAVLYHVIRLSMQLVFMLCFTSPLFTVKTQLTDNARSTCVEKLLANTTKNDTTNTSETTLEDVNMKLLFSHRTPIAASVVIILFQFVIVMPIRCISTLNEFIASRRKDRELARTWDRSPERCLRIVQSLVIISVPIDFNFWFLVTRDQLTIAAVFLWGWWEVIQCLVFCKPIYCLNITMSRTLKDLLFYIMVYVCMLLGAACALCVLGADTTLFEPDHKTANLVNTMTELFARTYSPGSFHNLRDCAYEFSAIAMHTVNIERFIFNLYVLAVTIIFITILLAKITKTYERAKREAHEAAMIGVYEDCAVYLKYLNKFCCCFFR